MQKHLSLPRITFSLVYWIHYIYRLILYRCLYIYTYTNVLHKPKHKKFIRDSTKQMKRITNCTFFHQTKLQKKKALNWSPILFKLITLLYIFMIEIETQGKYWVDNTYIDTLLYYKCKCILYSCIHQTHILCFHFAIEI